MGALLLLRRLFAPSLHRRGEGRDGRARGLLGGIARCSTAFPAIGSFTSLDFNQDQEFQNQGVTKDQVTLGEGESPAAARAQPRRSRTSPSWTTLRFYAKAGDQEVLIASKQDIASLRPQGARPVLDLDVRDVELQPYVTAPSMSIIVRGKGRVPLKDVRLQAIVTLDVQVQLPIARGTA